MKIDLSKAVVDHAGKAIKGIGDEDFTVADVFIETLMTGLQEDTSDSGTERLWRFRTAQNVEMSRESKDFELKADEFTKIKNRVLKVYLNPAIYATVDSLENGSNT